MSFEILEATPTITLNPISTVGFALLMYMIGVGLRKKFVFFRSYCIPAAVIGGMLYAIFNLIMHMTGLLAVKLTTTYQGDFQNLFFASVAFSISLSIVKKGGARLAAYAICSVILIVIQGVVGVFASEAVGLSGAFGIVLGPAPLAGGHANVAAYAQFLEDAGHKGMMVSGIAAACFGLVTASFFGGPMARTLIKKYNLKKDSVDTAIELEEKKASSAYSLPKIFYHLVILIAGVTFGTKLSSIAAGIFNISVPEFTGTLLLGLIVRLIDDRTHVLNLDESMLDKTQSFSLNIFLSLAIISLNLWELADLAVPMMIVLLIELVITLVYIRYALPITATLPLWFAAFAAHGRRSTTSIS